MLKEQELDDNLLKEIEKAIPRGRKSASVEEAVEKVLGFKKETKEDVITENEWI